MRNCDFSYWTAEELDAAIIQKEEFFMWGITTTNLHEVAEDVTEFLKTRYVLFVFVLSF